MLKQPAMPDGDISFFSVRTVLVVIADEIERQANRDSCATDGKERCSA
jgi:hypothetical protein